jgi:hypothetical protein
MGRDSFESPKSKTHEKKPGMVTHAYNPREAEAGGWRV